MKIVPSSIIISRTDSIGDMILTLPMAEVLKKHFKNIKVYFLGKEYTRDVVEACSNSDGFIEINDFLTNDECAKTYKPDAIIHVKPEPKVARRAKQLNIKMRVGTTNRLYHWTTCNLLVPLGRKKSNLHEAQLNLKLLAPLGIKKIFGFDEIAAAYNLNKLQPLEKEFALLIDKKKYNIILHPKSRGNAREWPLENYISLVHLLDVQRYKIFISGVEADKPFVQPLLNETGNTVTDIQGKMQLGQFMSFIAACDGLVACSTGPLHIAAATGINAYGIYPPIRPLHAGRWGPVGKKAEVFTLNKHCNYCRNNYKPCICINSISSLEIFNSIEKQAALKFS